MNCEKALAQLNAYLDNELSTEEKGQVDAHVLDCEACKAALQELAQNKTVLKNMSTPQLSPAFEQNIHAKLSTNNQSKKWGPFAVAASLALCSLLVIIYGFPSDEASFPDIPNVQPESVYVSPRDFVENIPLETLRLSMTCDGAEKGGRCTLRTIEKSSTNINT